MHKLSTSTFNNDLMIGCLLQVLKGMGIVHEVENADKGENDAPIEKIVIEECGELKEGEDVSI